MLVLQYTDEHSFFIELDLLECGASRAGAYSGYRAGTADSNPGDERSAGFYPPPYGDGMPDYRNLMGPIGAPSNPKKNPMRPQGGPNGSQMKPRSAPGRKISPY